MKLEAEVKMFKKKLTHEKERLERELGRIQHVMDTFDMNNQRTRRGPKAGRKLSKAHRLAIKRGIAAKRTAEK